MMESSSCSPSKSIASAVLYPTTLQASNPGPPFLLLVFPVLYLRADIGLFEGNGGIFLVDIEVALVFEELKSGDSLQENGAIGKESR